MRLPHPNGSGAYIKLPPLPPLLQGVVLIDSGCSDGSAARPKPRPVLLCHDDRIVAEVAAAEAALPCYGADSPERDAVEDAVRAVGCALAAHAPIQAAAAGACHAISRGWLAAADACCRAVTAAAAAAVRAPPNACAIGPNRLSLLHAAVASANPAMVERVLRCARDARAAYGRADAGDVLGSPATPSENNACAGVTPLHLAVAVASSDGGAMCAAALLGATRGGGGSAGESVAAADARADAALAWACFPDGRGVTPSAACRAAARRAAPSLGGEALSRLDAAVVSSVDTARPIAAAALASCLPRGSAGRHAVGGAAARAAAAEADALVRSLLDDPPPPVAGDDAPPPAHVLRVASAYLRAVWSRPLSFEEAASASAVQPLTRYALLLCLLAAPVLRLLRAPPASPSQHGQQAVWRAALADSFGSAACVAPVAAGASLTLCVLLPSLRARVYERFPTSTVACVWIVAFFVRQLLMCASPSLTHPSAPHNPTFAISTVAISFMASCAPMRVRPLAWLLFARLALLCAVTSRFPVAGVSPAACCVAHAAAMAAGLAIAAVNEAAARQMHGAAHPTLASPAARCDAAFRAAAWPLRRVAAPRVRSPGWVSTVPALLWSALFPGGAATRAAFAADAASTGDENFARTFMMSSLGIDSLLCAIWSRSRFFQGISVAAATSAILAGPQPLSHASMQRVMLSEPLWAVFPVAFLPYFFVFSPIRAVRAAYARPTVRAAVLSLTAVVRFFSTDMCAPRLIWARVGAPTPFLLPATTLLFETSASAMVAALPLPAPARVCLLLSRGLLPLLPQSWGVWISVAPGCVAHGRLCVSPHAVRWASIAAIIAVVVRAEAASLRAWAARQERRAQMKTE